MSRTAKSRVLRPLFIQLKACPARENCFSEEVVRQTWERFKVLAWEPEEELTPAAMAGLILFDGTFAKLLNEAERAQLVALAAKARERYQHETHPPNQLGKMIAATLEETI